MPWQLPDDMSWFKRQTMGKPVIMGRKTYESIPARFRPLTGRHNIILTSNRAFNAPNCAIAHTIADGITIASAHEKMETAQEVMVIGGGSVYAQFLPMVDRLYLTLINGRFTPTSPTYFPAYAPSEWHETYREERPKNGRHAHSFTWLILDRIR